MLKRNILLTAILIIFLASRANPQEIKVYTLDNAINEAFRNNSELVNARFDKAKADKKVTQTYNENLIPTITWKTVFIRSFKKQVFNIFGQQYEIGTDNSLLNEIDITEPIPFLGTPIFSGIRIAEYYSGLTDENVKAVETKIRTDVRKAFLNVLLLAEVLEVNKSALQNSQDNLTVVETRYRLGTVTEFDYLRAKVKVETLKPNINQVENNLSLSKKSLKNIMGLKTEEDIEVSGKLSFDSTEVYPDVNVTINKIAENNVAIRQLNISKQINEELVTIDKANYLPKLYLFGQYQLASNEDDGKSISNYSFFNTLSAGIGLSWTFNFFSNPYKKEQSEIDVKKSTETILDIKQKLRIQTQSILLKMNEAKDRMYSNTETMKLASRGYELSLSSFKNGVINQIDVLDAELMLTQTRLAYLNSVYDYMNAKAELEGLLER